MTERPLGMGSEPADGLFDALVKGNPVGVTQLVFSPGDIEPLILTGKAKFHAGDGGRGFDMKGFVYAGDEGAE